MPCTGASSCIDLLGLFHDITRWSASKAWDNAKEFTLTRGFYWDGVSVKCQVCKPSTFLRLKDGCGQWCIHQARNYNFWDGTIL